MYLFSKISSANNYYLNMLLALFPFSFIAGNMIININLLLIIISSIIIFPKDCFKIKFFILDKLIIAYFCLVLISSLVNDYELLSEKIGKEHFLHF